MLDSKFLCMCDAPEQKFSDRDVAYIEMTKTVTKLREKLEGESKKVSRLRHTVARLKTQNRNIKRIIKHHAVATCSAPTRISC